MDIARRTEATFANSTSQIGTVSAEVTATIVLVTRSVRLASTLRVANSARRTRSTVV